MAVNEDSLTTSTVNIIQVDWASPSTKMSTVEGNCICWHFIMNNMSTETVEKLSVTDHVRSILVVDTPQWHQCFPKSHHIQYSTGC